MKNQKGITLVSLVTYVIVMIIVLEIMSIIIINFYGNTNAVQGNIQEIVEFNKFNICFLKEVKENNNQVESYSSNYILFKTGSSFLLSGNSIYYNNIKVCDGVQSMNITLGKNGDGQDQTIINVTLNFWNFSKTINYKVENIY